MINSAMAKADTGEYSFHPICYCHDENFSARCASWMTLIACVLPILQMTDVSTCHSS